MKNTITELYGLQKFYLIQILQNIPEEKLFFHQENDVNSPGWVLGHLIVEVEDLLNFLKIELEPLPNTWKESFKGGKPWKQDTFEKLPTKKELIRVFELRYDTLIHAYIKMDDNMRLALHPSKMLSSFYTNVDAWFAHHLITHLAIHLGNITTWKQAHGIKVEGF